MAKNKDALFGDIFGELNKTAQGGQPTASDAPATQPTATTVVGVHSETDLQGKQGKQARTQKKKYDYGTKRTFPIPDDLWNDALIVMQAQGKKQVEFIQDLISRAVEENRATIEAVKKMRGEQ